MQNYDEFLTVALEMATKAGQTIKTAFYANAKVIENKSSQIDLVTDTDKQVEAFIKTTIKTHFPDHKFLGEESYDGEGYNLTNEPTWIVDPVDGTTNFVHRFPFVAVSIALAINKQTVVGVVFNPILNEMYRAVKGKGAYLNDQQIHVSSVEKLEQCMIATNVGYDRTNEGIDFMMNNLKHLLHSNVRAVRAGGTSAVDICSVACGRLDAYYEVGIHPWDIAAGNHFYNTDCIGDAFIVLEIAMDHEEPKEPLALRDPLQSPIQPPYRKINNRSVRYAFAMQSPIQSAVNNDLTRVANLIIEEAGGIMMDPYGKPLDLENRRVLAGNKTITSLIVEVLKKEPIPEKWLKYDKH